MIYVSTGGFKDQPAWVTSKLFKKNNILNIELSGGVFYENQLSELKKIKNDLNFQIHNYFPPPKDPFILNLASTNDHIVKRSFELIESSLVYCEELNCSKYSFHAGFLLDPKLSDLGNDIKSRSILPKEKALDLFLERVNMISKKAREHGVDLMIENNVLTKSNLNHFNQNPFLMVDTEDCIYVMKNTPDNVNLLIDLGHLNVSSKSLKFDSINFLKNCSNWVKGYHFSDNDGVKDQNYPINFDSWFWNYIDKNIEYNSLEIYNTTLSTLIDQINITKKILN